MLLLSSIAVSDAVPYLNYNTKPLFFNGKNSFLPKEEKTAARKRKSRARSDPCAAETLNTEKVELENQLHTVYYIVGAEKELREAQIIDKQGFIGRTLTVNNTSNLESFTKADSRLLSDRKSTRLNSSHANESRMPSSA